MYPPGLIPRFSYSLKIEIMTAIETFIYETTVIKPVKEILRKLKNNEFGDRDLKRLAEKLEGFTSIAIEVIGKKVIFPELDYTVLNDFTKAKLIKYFNIILSFFENID